MTDLTAGRGWLNPAPAASIARIDRALGHPLQITEAGRSWAQQKAHWDTYQSRGWPIALHPDGPPKGDGPSLHQKGAAIDSDEAQKHLNLMTEHGWIRTVYRNGRLVEPWHFEYAANRDQHINDAAPAATVPEEDDMPIMIKANVNIYVLSPGQIKLCDNVRQVKAALAAGIKQHDLTGTTAQQNQAFADLLDVFGVPQNIFNGNGWVLNPESGKHEKNGLWSWARANLAKKA